MYKLGNRVLFRLSGPDSFNFLQGLITSDLNLVSGKEARPALFLSSMGNVLSECFVFKHNDEIYLDTLRYNYNRILNIVKKRKLASKVNISTIESEVYVQLPKFSKYLLRYNNSNNNLNSNYNNNGNMVKLLDIRGRYFGNRYYDLLGNNNSNNNQPYSIEHLNGRSKELGVYEKNMILNCCLLDFFITRPSFMYFNYNHNDNNNNNTNKDSSNDTVDQSWFDGLKLMAFDLNLERFNYIGSNKGCYVGQEMVNRILNRMLINKYVLYLAVNNRVLDMDKDKLMNENKENNDDNELENLDEVEWFDELTLTKCINRLLNNNNKLLEKQEKNNEKKYKSNNNLLNNQQQNNSNRNNNNNLLEKQKLNLNNCYGDTYKLLKYLFSSKIEVAELNNLNEEVKKLVNSKKMVFVLFSENFGFVLLNRNLKMKYLNVNGELYSLEPVF